MKLKAATLRTFTTLHTWVGLLAGFALFVAFYAGAITVFHRELQAWQASAAGPARVDTLADAQRLLDETLRRHPEARTHVGMVFPGGESPQATIYWQDAGSAWRYATLDTLEGAPEPPSSGLSELVNALHFSLGLPIAGTYLMGVVSLLYGIALVSGTVIHLPKLLQDLFALRPGRNLKRFWQDAHNLVGVVSLPLHVMFAVTGALLCLVMVLLLALDPLVFRGGAMAAVPAVFDTAPARAAGTAPAEMGTLAAWTSRATQVAEAQGHASFDPAYLKLANAGRSGATIEITGAVPGALGPLGSVALDAATGEVLATQLPGGRDANHMTLAVAYALHFGDYGNAWVRVLYFVMGVGGAFLFYSGNLLWVESRRKRRQAAQGRAPTNMARATVGVCIGACVAIAVAAITAQLGQRWFPAHVDAALHWACFLCWGACALWAALRTPAQAAREVLGLAAIATALVPVAHGIASGQGPWTSAAAGHWPLFAVDATAIVLAAGFALLARASARRARYGEPNSVWAER